MATLIYDGDCGFCTTLAHWIHARLPAEHEITPWQSLGDLSALGLAEADVATASYWRDEDGQNFRGAAGVGHALRASSSRLWRAVGFVVLAPPLSWLAKPAYAAVAKNRHRLPGSTDACRIES